MKSFPAPRSIARAAILAALVLSTAACFRESPTGVVPVVLGSSTFDYPSVGLRSENIVIDAAGEVEGVGVVQSEPDGRGGMGYGSGN